mmetsp:Transcript_21000/g.71599  ORF Transcript_21000/g.71599 Transcript_21000/m.71599 type:complete len:151 (+) Transcript_21000:142-594(+)
MIGRLQFTGQGVCCDQRPFTFTSGGCCQPKAFKDSHWMAASASLAALENMVDDAVPGPLRMCVPLHMRDVKRRLDAAWTVKANEALAEHSLAVATAAGYRRVPGTVFPFLHLYVYELDNDDARAELRKLRERDEEMCLGPDDVPQRQSMV